ncbi:peptide/nickel transport system permease protein [Lentzea fradiae]|uniref:Peptide/nickel transport system permease protein n=1 Tax=Lentzea fradiae TaxID=200378 RepID=A0A1G7R2X5_9PSEU|nr:ABC transporter permease [Lentzea fradiae]SDG05064.1 peptide/nickel transport system permease protein [Lentzea fradiae]
MRIGARRSVPGWAVGSAVVAFVLLWAAFGPLPHDPRSPALSSANQAPGGDFWFGTTESGVDVFSGVVAASLSTLPIAFAGVLAGLLAGTAAGIALSGHSPVQEGFMRLVDLFQSFPVILVAIVVVALAEGDSVNFWLTAAIAVINFPIFLRIVRGSALVVRTERYVLAAEVMGASRWRVALRHIVPNVSNVVLAQASLSIGFGIMAIASLGYLGIGSAPPEPSWGAFIREGADKLGDGRWWMVVFPSLAICLTVLVFNMISRSISKAGAPSGQAAADQKVSA